MPTIAYNDINYAEILTFMSVAETLNMSITAQALHISQPAVSKRIHNLEQRYNLILFIRSHRRLQITPAGKQFYDELQQALQQLEGAFVKASAIQAAPVHNLNISYDGIFDIPILYQIIQRFMSQYPNTKVNVHRYIEEDCAELFNGRSDIMIAPDSFFAPTEAYVQHTPIAAYTFTAIVSKDHPLAQKEHLSIKDLSGVPLIAARSESTSPYVLAIKKLFDRENCSPRFEHFAPREDLCIDILIRKGVAIATPSFWNRLNERTSSFFAQRLKTYPLDNAEYPVSFVWKADNPDPYIQRFLKVYRQVISEGNNQELLTKAYQ